MSFSFSRFFTVKSAPTDGLTQPQREAIADLLHYCLYADNNIALAETAVIDATVSSLTWDPNHSFSVYEARSIAQARLAKEDPAARDEFLHSIRQRLDTPTVRALACDLCKRVFVADGTQTDRETIVLARIQQILA